MKKTLLHIAIIFSAIGSMFSASSSAIAQVIYSDTDIDVGQLVTVPRETQKHETSYRVNSTAGIVAPQKGGIIPGITFATDNMKARTGFDFMGKCAMYGTTASNKQIFKKDAAGNFVDEDGLVVQDVDGKVYTLNPSQPGGVIEVVGGSIDSAGVVRDASGATIETREIALDYYCNKF